MAGLLRLTGWQDSRVARRGLAQAQLASPQEQAWQVTLEQAIHSQYQIKYDIKMEEKKRRRRDDIREEEDRREETKEKKEKKKRDTG